MWEGLTADVLVMIEHFLQNHPAACHVRNRAAAERNKSW